MGAIDEVRIYNRALSANEIEILSTNTDTQSNITQNSQIKETGQTSQKTNSSNGLVAYYPFDGNANDYSGNGNHGIIQDNNKVTPTTGVDGKSNSAYMFSGGNIKVPNSPTLKFSRECTFSAFVKPTQKMSSNRQPCHCVIAKSYDQVGITMMQFYIEDNKITMDWGLHGNNQTNKWVSHNNAVGLNGNYFNKWVHFAIVVDNTKAKFYINGQLMYEQTVTTPDFFSTINNQDLFIGKNSVNWYGLMGAIDEVRIYNRALSANDIKKLSQNQVP